MLFITIIIIPSAITQRCYLPCKLVLILIIYNIIINIFIIIIISPDAACYTYWPGPIEACGKLGERC